MATINLYTYGITHGNEKIRYALNKRLPGDPVSSNLCDMEAETVIQQFAASRDFHDSKCAKPIAEMIHSFSPEESKRIGSRAEAKRTRAPDDGASIPGHRRRPSLGLVDRPIGKDPGQANLIGVSFLSQAGLRFRSRAEISCRWPLLTA